MTENPKWPSYRTGDQNIIFAIGVASTNFTLLESGLGLVFTNILDLESDAAEIIFSKLGNEGTLDILDSYIPKCSWTDKAKDYAIHFVKCFKICLDNRNQLSHSNVMMGNVGHPEHRVGLYKRTKKGHTESSTPTLAELRSVSDDIRILYDYCLAFNNAMVNERGEIPIFSSSVFPWPEKPALPRSLHYSRDPQPL
jgi:hypothetical protein